MDRRCAWMPYIVHSVWTGTVMMRTIDLEMSGRACMVTQITCAHHRHLLCCPPLNALQLPVLVVIHRHFTRHTKDMHRFYLYSPAFESVGQPKHCFLVRTHVLTVQSTIARCVLDASRWAMCALLSASAHVTHSYIVSVIQRVCAPGSFICTLAFVCWADAASRARPRCRVLHCFQLSSQHA